jgi:predicted phage terminase large subunit-like protein
MKKDQSKRGFDWILRHDLHAFVERSFYELNPTTQFQDNWHIGVITDRMEQLRAGDLNRAVVNVPPRSLKSHIASGAFPAFLLGHDPSAQIICVSYAQDLSNKFAADCRTLMSSKMYSDVFPTRLSSQRPALQELTTTRHGFRYATSIGGVLTGRGADYIIIDDPLKPEEAFSETARQNVNDWFDHTLLPRLNNKATGRIAVIMQRLHEDDLTGHIINKLGKENCSLVRFPSIADEDETYIVRGPFGHPTTYSRRKGDLLHAEREDRATLDKLRASMGSDHFNAQYQQSPVPPDGGIIKEVWFKRYTPENIPQWFSYILQSWDTANKATELSDYGVCTTWGVLGKTFYLLNVFREKMDYPTLKRAVIEHKQYWSARTALIEDKASGTQLIQELNCNGHYGFARYTLPPGQDKVMRMHLSCAMIENGFVYLPVQAEWLGEYLHELRAFPHGKYDDQVDSTSQALDWVQQRYLNTPTVGVFPVRL